MKSWPIATCIVATLAAFDAWAGECVANSGPVAPATLASELEAGFGFLPGELSNVPFSVVSYGYQQVQITWAGCGQDCVFATYPGDAQCGDLVSTPVESNVSREIVGIPNPNALSTVFAGQVDGGRWNVLAQALVNPSWDETNKSAAYSFDLGTREVIDVGGSAGAVDIHLRARSTLIGRGCVGNFVEWIPLHKMRFRVTERTTFTTLVQTQFWDQFFDVDETFTIAVQPGWVLQVDLYFDVFANATGETFIGTDYCAGAIANLDFTSPPAGEGLQLFYDPDPGVTLTPRSGIVYEVPEPSAAAAAVIAIVLLAARKRLT
jgi:hypothetical protein